MSKRIILIMVAGLFQVLFFGRNNLMANDKPPNFIFILADDLGWTSHSYRMDSRYSSSGSDFYETPCMDRLVAKGMRFTNAYAPAAICCPSRRGIQFGQTPARLGDLTFKEKYAAHRDQWLTIPGVLKSIDPRYRSAHFGKWDLRAAITPEDIGYDESDGDTGNRNGDVMVDKGKKWTDVYLNDDPKKTVSLTDRALDFVKRQNSSGHPFFLQLSYYATHVDIQAGKEAFQKFSQKKKGEIHNNAGFAAMLYELDKGIGRIMDKLKELGIDNNTYIIFMADNGGVDFIPPPPVKDKMNPPASFGKKMGNYPLRGGKWVLYEGGIRVPFIVCGPHIKQGTVSNVPVAGFDLLPTIGDLAGGIKALPEFLDGGSIKPVLHNRTGDKIIRKEDAFFFHRYNNAYKHSSIIDGRYKLVKIWKTNKLELYDLENDIGEVHDLSPEMPELAKKMNEELIAYFQKVGSEALSSGPLLKTNNKSQ
ncbi:sulfatase [Niabella aurantiaca]|uniref:sulfatase n=1 Tax=Niabella aurantiaca TaxID=379900 RepID=UPI00146D9620|nr:sulfatase [Niabella aurantiaca]